MLQRATVLVLLQRILRCAWLGLFLAGTITVCVAAGLLRSEVVAWLAIAGTLAVQVVLVSILWGSRSRRPWVTGVLFGLAFSAVLGVICLFTVFWAPGNVVGLCLLLVWFAAQQRFRWMVDRAHPALSSWLSGRRWLLARVLVDRALTEVGANEPPRNGDTDLTPERARRALEGTPLVGLALASRTLDARPWDFASLMVFVTAWLVVHGPTPQLARCLAPPVGPWRSPADPVVEATRRWCLAHELDPAEVWEPPASSPAAIRSDAWWRLGEAEAARGRPEAAARCWREGASLAGFGARRSAVRLAAYGISSG